MKGMKESYIEELATHCGPESCVPVREDRRAPEGRVGIEALTESSTVTGIAPGQAWRK